jgi:hypothetical protein
VTEPAWLRPQPTPSGMMPEFPESRLYRVKRALLAPLMSENLHSNKADAATFGRHG